jgi:hypothetical protein
MGGLRTASDRAGAGGCEISPVPDFMAVLQEVAPSSGSGSSSGSSSSGSGNRDPAEGSGAAAGGGARDRSASAGAGVGVGVSSSGRGSFAFKAAPARGARLDFVITRSPSAGRSLDASNDASNDPGTPTIDCTAAAGAGGAARCRALEGEGELSEVHKGLRQLQAGAATTGPIQVSLSVYADPQALMQVLQPAARCAGALRERGWLVGRGVVVREVFGCLGPW